jgi:hypothetical protein
MQKILSAEQLEKFYHDQFVDDQVHHFVKLFSSCTKLGVITDIGGGCGYFARNLQNAIQCHVRVVDMDEASVAACHAAGVAAIQGNALTPAVSGDEDVVCFNLVLHHLVGNSDYETLTLQLKALTAWRSTAREVFVNEYIYESFLGNFSGWLIYQITSSKILSLVAMRIAKLIPSLNANTFGVGVRFRAHNEWRRVFEDAGYTVRRTITGDAEPVSLARRLLCIKYIRRDSFALVPKTPDYLEVRP